METYRSELRGRVALRRALRNQQRRLGERLRALRQQHGLTQAEAALEVGLSKRQLGRLEGGESNVTLATLVALASAYGVEVWELFRGELPPKRGQGGP